MGGSSFPHLHCYASSTVHLAAPAVLCLQSMDRLGDATLKPFLQDVIQLKPLVQTLGKQASGGLACISSAFGCQCGQLPQPLRHALSLRLQHRFELTLPPAAPAGICCRIAACLPARPPACLPADGVRSADGASDPGAGGPQRDSRLDAALTRPSCLYIPRLGRKGGHCLATFPTAVVATSARSRAGAARKVLPLTALPVLTPAPNGACPAAYCCCFLQKYVPIIEKLPPKQRFLMRRALENWRFGAGKDYRL
jgi:hypothetical protein